jgi:hypothetical protein
MLSFIKSAIKNTIQSGGNAMLARLDRNNEQADSRFLTEEEAHEALIEYSNAMMPVIKNVDRELQKIVFTDSEKKAITTMLQSGDSEDQADQWTAFQEMKTMPVALKLAEELSDYAELAMRLPPLEYMNFIRATAMIQVAFERSCQMALMVLARSYHEGIKAQNQKDEENEEDEDGINTLMSSWVTTNITELIEEQ